MSSKSSEQASCVIKPFSIKKIAWDLVPGSKRSTQNAFQVVFLVVLHDGIVLPLQLLGIEMYASPPRHLPHASRGEVEDSWMALCHHLEHRSYRLQLPLLRTCSRIIFPKCCPARSGWHLGTPRLPHLPEVPERLLLPRCGAGNSQLGGTHGLLPATGLVKV